MLQKKKENNINIMVNLIKIFLKWKDFKDLNRRTAADIILCNEALNIAKNPKFDEYQCGLSSVVCNLFDQKTSSDAIKKEIMQNEELAKELHKTIIRKLEKRKKYTHLL